MKVIDLGDCALALEPDKMADRVGSLDIARLKSHGVSERAIEIYRRYALAPNISPPSLDTFEA
jgi:hypothetical protein